MAVPTWHPCRRAPLPALQWLLLLHHHSRTSLGFRRTMANPSSSSSSASVFPSKCGGLRSPSSSSFLCPPWAPFAPLRFHRTSSRTSTTNATTTTTTALQCTAVYQNNSGGSVRNKLEEFQIYLQSCQPGKTYRLLCPKCRGGKSKENSLAVTIDKDGENAVWICFRGNCGWKGFTKHTSTIQKGVRQEIALHNLEGNEISEESLGLQPLSVELMNRFLDCGISERTLKRNQVKQVPTDKEFVVAFPYFEDGKIVNCKLRNTSWHPCGKARDGKAVFYGLDDVKGAEKIIIVQSEIDKLSMEEAGFSNCVGVPDWAPVNHSRKPFSPERQKEDWKAIEQKYLGFFGTSEEFFRKDCQIILATNSDASGQALGEALARRFGRERCWRVKWPKVGMRMAKNANEVLQKLGKDIIGDMIHGAELYPISGLFQFSHFFSEIDDYYQTPHEKLCFSTGWQSLDKFYRVVPGELTLITGVPNSGKSEWIDALLCNLNCSFGWTFALCSLEGKVREHGVKLMEKKLRKPFFEVAYAKSEARLTKEDLEKEKQWLNNSFYLMRCEDEELPTFSWLLKLARSAVLRHGIRGLVIDPYNELDHMRPSSETETEYVNRMLIKIKRFAKLHDCHVWLVAHPRQLRFWNGGPPNLYDVCGSAHFINQCDNGIVIHRNNPSNPGPNDGVQVLVEKVRNKDVGRIGQTILAYNRITGEFKDWDDTM